FGELLGVHLGGRGHPQLDRDVALAFQQLGGRPEVADVGHAAADEYLVDLGAGHVGQGLDVVGVVRARHDGFVDVGQVDFDYGGVVGVGVRLQQLGIGQPGFHGLDAAAQRALVFVAVGDHPLQHHDVAVDVFD